MPLLVIEPRMQSRETLRRFLKELGHTTVLEGTTCKDAIQMLQNNQSRITFILLSDANSDEGTLAILRKVEELPTLHSVPLLFLKSETNGEPSPQALLAEYPRVDALLYKPFVCQGLEKAMTTAYCQRLKCRPSILLVSSDKPFIASVLQGLGDNSKAFFNRVVPISSESEFALKTRLIGKELCTVLVDSDSLQGFNKNWLTQFKKTPDGQKTTVVCIGKDPKWLESVRQHSELFLDKPTTPKQLKESLALIHTHLVSRWDTDRISNILKQALKTQQNNKRSFIRLAAKTNSFHPSTLFLIGDYFRKLGKTKEAVKYYEASINLNPVVPSAHLHLMELLSQLHEGEKLKTVAERALRYCPEHPQTVQRVANMQGQLGDTPGDAFR